MESFFCTDLQATPVQILEWVIMRWSVEVTCEEARAHLGLETQRQWSDHAIARTTPVLLALCSLVTVLALTLSQDGNIPVPMTAWYRKGEPTFSDGLALVRWHLWRARYVVNSTDFSVTAPRPPLVRARPRASVKVFDVKDVFDTLSCRGSPKSRRHGSKTGFRAPKHALHDLRLSQLTAKNLFNNKYFHGVPSWRPHESWL